MSGIYGLIENFVLYTLTFIFFQILINCLFSAYYYMSLNDFRSIFLYEFKLIQSAAETARKINQTFGNDSVNERTVPADLRNFVLEILASKMSPEVVDLQ